tara:strand:+ start:1717 stop:1980 length:264 start_codon:yes stop_codon:yes gene_type:complete
MENVFSNQRSISAFLKEDNSAEIQLIRNPQTGKIFFSTSQGTTGRVSTKVDKLNASLYVSQFSPEDGNASLMLHTSDHTNVVDTFSL